MPDTKEGREKQARDAEERQRERELAEARERADESEPEPPVVDEERGSDDGTPPTCHRRDCDEPAAFAVLERYQEGAGHGAVEAEALLCRAHTAEESPTNLDGAYPDYVFRVEPLPATAD